MKSIALTIFTAFLFMVAHCQIAYINGTPLSVVSSASLTVSDSIDLGAYPSHIASTADGAFLFVSTFYDTHIIDVSDNSIHSTIAGLSGKFAASQSETHMYGIKGTQFYSIDLADNSLDSISLPATDRLTHRPGTDEVWVTSDSVVHVVDVSNGMSLSTTFTTGTSPYDGSEVRFSEDGSVAVKMNWNSKTAAKIDAATKSVEATLDLGFLPNLAGVEVSSDGGAAFISCSNNKKVYKIDVSTMSISDSATMPQDPFGMYRHPTDDNIWVVGHFHNVVYIMDPSDLSVIDSIKVPGDPHIVEFMNTPVGMENLLEPAAFQIFPNPTNTRFTLASDRLGNTWQMYDLNGRIIKEGIARKNHESVDVSDVRKGLYIIRSDAQTIKLVVE